ncbi:transglutaminaseTgpA domain-containing protein [Aquihabitans sp. McL0605]|uniref:transglutaminase family protein n=1 Tax=Aquihabitans sp. McL0605 TaxID=3415671 RepID=UPI003CF2E0FA
MSPARHEYRHPDRAQTPSWLSTALLVATCATAAVAGANSAHGRLTAPMGAAIGAGLALLAMLGLPSLSVSLVSRVVLFVSALALIRFGTLGAGGATSQWLLVWLLAGVCVLVLSDRVGTDANRPLRSGPGASAPGRPASVARTVVAVAAVVLLLTVLLAPMLLPYVGKAAQAGQGATLDPRRGDTTALRATDSLDMTQRPDLTDKVVFTVDTDRATYWRGETFDVWDGRRWTRSDSSSAPLPADGRPVISADDLGGSGSDVVDQRFRMRADYADVIYAAPTAVKVEVDGPVRQVTGGTLLTAPLGPGATYSVQSRRVAYTPELLRSLDGAIPADVSATYAQAPVTTDRVRKAATQVTAGATSQYDKILALESWMGGRVEYSLDAPLAPKGVDVVDHFLFKAKQGWCEQIASSLVVLARANGIPARLATGFVPDDRDAITGVYDVRERDAHAWAEVWFPKVGWVPFDPTAHVAMAGSDKARPTVLQWLVDHAVVIALGVAVVVLLIGPVRALVRRRGARRPRRSADWAVTADRQLDALGRRVDRARGSPETASAYAAALALRYDDPLLIEVGRTIDDGLYAEHPPSAERQAEAAAILRAVAAAPVPEPVPAPA